MSASDFPFSHLVTKISFKVIFRVASQVKVQLREFTFGARSGQLHILSGRQRNIRQYDKMAFRPVRELCVLAFVNRNLLLQCSENFDNSMGRFRLVNRQNDATRAEDADQRVCKKTSLNFP